MGKIIKVNEVNKQILKKKQFEVFKWTTNYNLVVICNTF